MAVFPTVWQAVPPSFGHTEIVLHDEGEDDNNDNDDDMMTIMTIMMILYIIPKWTSLSNE